MDCSLTSEDGESLGKSPWHSDVAALNTVLAFYLDIKPNTTLYGIKILNLLHLNALKNLCENWQVVPCDLCVRGLQIRFVLCLPKFSNMVFK